MEELPYSAKMMLNLLGNEAKNNPLLNLIEKQQKEIEELKDKIEKLIPFIDMFNDHFGTNLTLGSDVVKGTLEKYYVVPGSALEPFLKANEKTDEEKNLEKLRDMKTELEIPWLDEYRKMNDNK
ncbi:hypothetical protein V7150_19320 [Neobacillus drentensis]|uniref:hypothetical protein n=1 Tax=Neobacillus drentensis TaxID=220684 RepID=UPI003000A4FF